ncbi:YfhD family protein [Oceanobacillus manasiensis]|uniref:YfhD family protein n=1 Tax=Oceanobacillus manasiensis TaxID=586413 RepID=UPI0009FD5425|nr:YfhD family protein [Oceanobacillus manasiensis]
MGRDEHRNSKNNFLAQTPKNLKDSDGVDIEFSKELADQDDLEAQERSKAADRRAKKK